MSKRKTALATLGLATIGLGLSACGSGRGSGVSDHDRQLAKDFCGGTGKYVFRGMGIDQYQNPEGFDRCVKNAAKVVDCLGPSSHSLNPWIPPNCDNNGYM